MKYTYHKAGTKPTKGEIFVFGSNLAGIHGAGAAREANMNYGARWGIGLGMTGNSYAIPTKDRNIQTMNIDTISEAIEMFKDFVSKNPQLTFFVTGVGCGLAGFNASDIAPLFKGSPSNCNFQEDWRQYLE